MKDNNCTCHGFVQQPHELGCPARESSPERVKGEEPRSKCCDWPAEIVSSDEGTNYYGCIRCGSPCDLKEAATESVEVPRQNERAIEDHVAFSQWGKEVDAIYNDFYFRGADDGWHAALQWERSSVPSANENQAQHLLIKENERLTGCLRAAEEALRELHAIAQKLAIFVTAVSEVDTKAAKRAASQIEALGRDAIQATMDKVNAFLESVSLHKPSK